MSKENQGEVETKEVSIDEIKKRVAATQKMIAEATGTKQKVVENELSRREKLLALYSEKKQLFIEAKKGAELCVKAKEIGSFLSEEEKAEIQKDFEYFRNLGNDLNLQGSEIEKDIRSIVGTDTKDFSFSEKAAFGIAHHTSINDVYDNKRVFKDKKEQILEEELQNRADKEEQNRQGADNNLKSLPENRRFS